MIDSIVSDINLASDIVKHLVIFCRRLLSRKSILDLNWAKYKLCIILGITI